MEETETVPKKGAQQPLSLPSSRDVASRLSWNSCFSLPWAEFTAVHHHAKHCMEFLPASSGHVEREDTAEESEGATTLSSSGSWAASRAQTSFSLADWHLKADNQEPSICILGSNMEVGT